MTNLVGRLGTRVFGEGIRERLDKLGMGEYKGERESTKRFLAYHGENIPTLESIAEKGDLIALIDGWGGFIAFVTNGFANKYAREHQERRLYDQELMAAGDLAREVVSVKLNTPEWFYKTRLHRKSKDPLKFPQNLDQENEVWYRSRDIPAEAFSIVPKIIPRVPTKGWMLSSGDIREGNVYRLTSHPVIERIKGNIHNLMNSPTFYYVNSN